jgi:hypothetical protein
MKKSTFKIAMSLGILLSQPIIMGPVKTSHVSAATQDSFSDVKSSFWAYTEIQELKNKGIAEALVNNQFAPNKEITRAKAARMIVKSLGIEQNSLKNVSFKDVPRTHKDYKYIALAVNKGIFNGVNSTTFNPEGKLTRAQMAKILTLSFDLRTRQQAQFKDVKANHWAYEYVNILYWNQISTVPDMKFSPNQPVTRAHQAVFLYRSMKKPALPEYMKDTTLFDENIQVAGYTLGNPLMKKILVDGQDVVRKNGMKFIDAVGGVEAQSDGYKNPIDSNYRQVRISERGTDQKSFYLRFDFRDARAVDVASTWFDILLPQTNLKDSIRDKALEGKNNEYRGIMFEGNAEIIRVGDYKIKYGVTPILDFFNMEVEYIGK